MSHYPEWEKTRAANEGSSVIEDFLGWLAEQNILLARWQSTYACDWRNGRSKALGDDRRCVEGTIWDGPENEGKTCDVCGGTGRARYHEPRLELAPYNLEDLLARFHKIDLVKLHEEQRAMLADLESRG